MHTGANQYTRHTYRTKTCFMLVWNIPNFVNKGRQVGSIGWVNKQSTYLRCLWLQLVSLYNFSVSFKQSVIGRHRYAEIKISFFVSFSAIAYRLLYLYLFYFISPSLASAQYDQIARLFIYSLGIYNIQNVPKIIEYANASQKVCQLFDELFQNGHSFLPLCHFGEISPNLVTLPLLGLKRENCRRRRERETCLKMCFGKTFKNIVFLSLFVARKWK